MSEDLRQEYARRHESTLQVIAERLQNYLTDCLKGMPRVDRITARAKAVDSFIVKATGVAATDTVKYNDPLAQIQDIVGARVIVFYAGDVERVETIVRRYLVPIEHRRVVPESHWSFGYSGLHMVLALPEDVITAEIDRNDCPEFFELQVKTLFQHAWSEANHDLGYKPIEELTSEQQRRLAFAAAQAWGADREFKELQTELGPQP